MLRMVIELRLSLLGVEGKAMRKQQLEARALDICERVQRQHPIEDSHVELKASWPSSDADMARRLAAHANAARGDDALWLIGVDEKSHQITGATIKDTADWWPQIQSYFDDVSPDLSISLAVPVDGKTVVALLFATDRAPYVVKTGDGRVSHEVPYRRGTATRSIMRSELLRLLVPKATLPQVRWEHATLDVVHHPNGWRWQLNANVVLVHLSERPSNIVQSDTYAWLENSTQRYVSNSCSFQNNLMAAERESMSFFPIQVSKGVLRLAGTGVATLVASGLCDEPRGAEQVVGVSFSVVEADGERVKSQTRVDDFRQEQKGHYRWKFAVDVPKD